MKILSMPQMPTIFAALALAFSSLIQAHASYRVGTMNVPFAFEYGSHTLAGGVYTISLLGDKIISINGATAGISMVLPSLDQNAARSNKLVFDKVGSQYFLRKIYVAGSTAHAECMESKAEEEALSRLRIANHPGPENVVVASR